MNRVARHKVASWSILAALLLSLLPMAALQPAVALAQENDVVKPAQTSVNPNEEIVYIDGQGYVRVLDVEAPNTPKTVQFVSPGGGWRSAALGDFNNDGDKEIVVVGGSGPSSSVLTVYDPVVAAGQTVPGQEINGVPWKQLASFALPDRPEVVAAGNFDPNVDGDEILVVRETVAGEAKNDNDWRIVIFHQTTAKNGNGTQWSEHAAINTGEHWDRINVANLDNTGGDEFVVAESGVAVRAYQPDQSMRKLFEYGSSCRQPYDATFGDYFKGGNKELLMVTDPRCASSSNQDSFRVYSYTNNAFPADPGAVGSWQGGILFTPGPRTVFTGDINGSGDDEAILLRKVENDPTAARLIVRSNGDDQVISEFQNGLPLSDDNGYLAGAAGDIDGDGKDEIVIIRNNNIRYYPDANTSAQAVDYATTTNRRTIAIGDLDAAGSTSGPVFATSVAKLDLQVNYGFVQSGQIVLKNAGTEDSVPFTAVSNFTPFQVTPTSGLAPGKSKAGITLNYSVDARNLQIGQTLQATLSIFNAGTPQATNSPLIIPVTIKVVTPPFEAIPAGTSALFIPCDAPAARNVTFTLSGLPGSQLRDVQVWDAATLAAAGVATDLKGALYLGARSADGSSLVLHSAAGDEQVLAATGRMNLLQAAAVDATTDLTYTSQVPWITSITVNTTTLPSQLTLTVDPTLRTKGFEQAGLVLIGPSYDVSNPIAVRSYPINMVCSNWGTWMPVLGK
jgi:hypothetical protein